MTLVPGLKVGLQGELYYNSSDYDTPTLVFIERAVDVSVNLEDGETEANSRASKFELAMKNLKKISLEFDYIWNSADDVAVYLLKSMWQDAIVDLIALDDKLSVDGTTGFRVVGYLFSANKSEKLTEGQKMSFSCKPTLLLPQIDPTVVISDGSAISEWDFS